MYADQDLDILRTWGMHTAIMLLYINIYAQVYIVQTNLRSTDNKARNESLDAQNIAWLSGSHSLLYDVASTWNSIVPDLGSIACVPCHEKASKSSYMSSCQIQLWFPGTIYTKKGQNRTSQYAPALACKHCMICFLLDKHYMWQVVIIGLHRPT